MVEIKKNKGITLIALVITIIVLIILAGISIATLTGDNSIIKKATSAKKETNDASEKETLQVAIISAKIESHNKEIRENDLNKALKDNNVEIEKTGKYYNVTFKDSKKTYRIDPEGNIKDYKKMDSATEKIYAKLYTDNTVILSSFKYTDENRTVQEDYDTGTGWRASGCTTVIIYDDIAPKNSYGREMFTNCTNLERIENIEKFHTENITDMGRMFVGCKSLTSVDLTYFNTNNVTNMRQMFWSCISLEKLDLSSFNTENVNDMYAMFYRGGELGDPMVLNEIIGIEDLNTSNVTSMRYMFSGCYNIQRLNIEKWDTSKVEDMNSMFLGCSPQNNYDFSRWNIENVLDFSRMFFGCEVEKIIMPGANSKATAIGQMFQGCKAKEIDISGITGQNITSVGSMFNGAGTPKTIDMSSFSFDNVTSGNYFIAWGSGINDVIYVKDAFAQQFVMDHKSSTVNWTTDKNVIIKNN